jgi:fused signal recognition particle receptor
MVFNWFRRKFDGMPAPEEHPAAADTEQMDETAEAEVEAEAEAEPPAPASTEVATDYLAWAKAAYQNIQQQQAAVQPEIVAEPTAETTPTTEPAPLPESGTDPDPESLPESVAATVTDAEPDIEITIPAAEPVVVVTEEVAIDPPVTEPAADLPIWARDDRQERLERLKATAIETVEPAERQRSEIDLDDDFLWSAKVLADAGRTPEQVSLDEINWLKKLRQGLDKTRRGFVNQFKALIGQGPLDAAAVESIEMLLLQSDVGIEATDYVIDKLQTKLLQETLPPEEALAYLKQILRDILDKPFEQDYQADFVPVPEVLNIWLMVGVNGVGKTTTIGKIAHMSQQSGYKCLIAAGDTFRAAAVEQVKVWGQRSGIEVIANPGQNTDPAAVVFDAISAARSRGTELLLVDTAGRLQNKKNLMDELSKIRRIVDKQAENAQIESLLVLDATLGQNGLRQAQVFAEAAKLSGVVLTKLDGTAKGGVALAVVQQLGLPIRFVGAGEGIEDLRPFSSYEFVEALLSG